MKTLKLKTTALLASLALLASGLAGCQTDDSYQESASIHGHSDFCIPSENEGAGCHPDESIGQKFWDELDSRAAGG